MSRRATSIIPGTELYKSYFTHRICLFVPIIWTVLCIGSAIYYAVNKWYVIGLIPHLSNRHHSIYNEFINFFWMFSFLGRCFDVHLMKFSIFHYRSEKFNQVSFKFHPWRSSPPLGTQKLSQIFNAWKKNQLVSSFIVVCLSISEKFILEDHHLLH